MLPLQLKIKGIYSYREEQTIDFATLTQGQLFGIFGAVGSGKSTILEAMSLALYDKTERFGSGSGGRNYNMMNLKSDALSVVFDFRASTGAEYRFSVEAARNSKNFTKVKTFQRASYVKQAEEWVPTAEKAEDIIGLNYENFHRTVIIPQGKFSEFLQLTDSKRSEMMQEIFQLDKYDLKDATGKILSRQKELITGLEGNLKSYEDISDELLKETENAAVEKQQEQKIIDKNLQTAQTDLQKAEQLQAVFAEIKNAVARHKKLKADERKYADLKTQIKQTRECREKFLPLMEKCDGLQKDTAAGEKEYARQEKAEAANEKDLSVKNAEYLEVKVVYDARETSKNQAEELLKILKINDLEKETRKYEERLTKGENIVRELKKQTAKKTAEANEVSKQKEKAEADKPDNSELTELQIWFSEQKIRTREVTETRAEHDAAEVAYKETTTGFKAVLEEAGCVVNGGGLKAAAKQLVSEKERVTADIERQQKAAEEIRLHGKLEEFAANLHEGAPCPVCGATEHPQLLDSEENLKKLTKIEEETSRLKQRREQLTACIRQTDSLLAQAAEQHKYWLKKKTELTEKEEKSAEHRASFPGKNFNIDEAEKVKAAARRVKETEEQIDKLAQQEKKLLLEIKKTEQKERESADLLTEIKAKLAAKNSEKETLLRQLKILRHSDFAEVTAAELTRRAEEIRSKIAAAESRYNILDKEIDALQKEKNSLDGQMTQTAKQNEKLRKKSAAATAELTEKITASDYADEDAVQQVLAAKLDTDKAESDYENYIDSFKNAESEVKRLEVLTAGQVFDTSDFAEKKMRAKELDEQQKSIIEKIGELKNRARELTENLAKKANLDQKLTAARAREENIKILFNLFSGKKFVDFISSVQLQNLCNAANARFKKLTNEQLRLELKDNKFIVRDYLNGGKTRSARTLSGGQTFQASLSLALALAESVQQQNRAEQNFFFLDEGFGTQDKQSLQAVFEALKSLRKENRIVGVISHVEELQQEIEVNLQIRNDEERGSLVEESWA